MAECPQADNHRDIRRVATILNWHCCALVLDHALMLIKDIRRLSDVFLWRFSMLTRLIVAVIALALCGPAFADDLIGQASVIDGDTIEIHGTRIRIFGIVAPESDTSAAAACPIASWPTRARCRCCG
jgi:hypothetical protein